MVVPSHSCCARDRSLGFSRPPASRTLGVPEACAGPLPPLQPVARDPSVLPLAHLLVPSRLWPVPTSLSPAPLQGRVPTQVLWSPPILTPDPWLTRQAGGLWHCPPRPSWQLGWDPTTSSSYTSVPGQGCCGKALVGVPVLDPIPQPSTAPSPVLGTHHPLQCSLGHSSCLCRSSVPWRSGVVGPGLLIGLFPGPIPGVLGAPLSVVWMAGSGLCKRLCSGSKEVGGDSRERRLVGGGRDCFQGKASLLRWEMKRHNLL